VRVAVFGAGGVGGYFGGRLAEAGEDVIFIARGEHLDAMRAFGLHVESPDGDFKIDPVHATDDPAIVGAVDVVLVAVKAWQVPEVAATIRPMMDTDTFVVPLENGVEAPEQLSHVLGREHVLGGLCAIISFIDGPGRIKHAGYEPFVAFGELDDSSSERAEHLRDSFMRAGVKATIPPDIHVAMWQKFLFITCFSGVAAVTRSPAGVIRKEPETRQLLERAFDEVVAVAKARGVALPDDAAATALKAIDDLPEDGTPSMQRDIMNGKPSELESQNGAVVRLGRESGVPTPVHEFIYASLLPQEQAARATTT
jgi:2-dehydropantoate 2-reductase